MSNEFERRLSTCKGRYGKRASSLKSLNQEVNSPSRNQSSRPLFCMCKLRKSTLHHPVLVKWSVKSKLFLAEEDATVVNVVL